MPNRIGINNHLPIFILVLISIKIMRSFHILKYLNWEGLLYGANEINILEIMSCKIIMTGINVLLHGNSKNM